MLNILKDFNFSGNNEKVQSQPGSNEFFFVICCHVLPLWIEVQQKKVSWKIPSLILNNWSKIYLERGKSPTGNGK